MARDRSSGATGCLIASSFAPHFRTCQQDGANQIKIADFGLSRMIAAADERRGLADAYLRRGRAAASEAAAARAAKNSRSGGKAKKASAGDLNTWDAENSSSSSDSEPSAEGELQLNGGAGGRYANMTGRTGTLKYMSPEVYRQEHYDLTCDVFSFGCGPLHQLSLYPFPLSTLSRRRCPLQLPTAATAARYCPFEPSCLVIRLSAGHRAFVISAEPTKRRSTNPIPIAGSFFMSCSRAITR